MATCRACDAPLKVGANYCVVCGAKQRRLHGPHIKFGALQLAFAALACGVIAAAFSIGLGKPDVHEVRATPAATASNPSDAPAPAAYVEERAEERVTGEPLITPQASATEDVPEPREISSDTRRSTTSAAPAPSRHAKATITAPIVPRTTIVQPPVALDRSSTLPPALQPAASDVGASAPAAATAAATPAAPPASPTPAAPPAALNPPAAAMEPTKQAQSGANEPVRALPEIASIKPAPPSVAYQGRTSSEPTGAVRGPRTLDEVFRQRTVRCGDGVIGFLCRETLRLNVCNGHWTENPVPGMTACYVAGR